MKHKKIWNFKYRGIHCEIVHWDFNHLYDFPSKGIWNGYIIITEEQVPDRFKELLVKRKKTNYKSMPWMWEYWGLDNLFKMNGGITYYSVIRDEFDGRKIAVKVGNDYNHSWNVGMRYDEECIEIDLMSSVDLFLEQYPDYLVWSHIEGKYMKPEEITNKE